MSDQVHYKTSCGSCQGRIEFPAAAAGATIRCPHCGASTVLHAPGGTPPAPAPAPAPVASPAATTKGACQHCNGNIAFPTAAAGSTVNCPHCGKPTKLGASGGAVQEGIEAALSEISAKEKLKPKKKPAAPGSGGGKGKMLAIVGAVVVLLAGLGVGAMLMLKKKAPAGPKKPEKDLEVLTHQLQKAKEGGLVYVIGTVTNHSEQQYFSLKIEFELSDKDGKSLGMVSDYVGNLGAHKVWDFKALVLEDSTAQAKLVKLEGEPESAPAPSAPKVEEQPK